MIRCKNCGEKQIRFPIWDGQEKEVPFSWDKIIWKNLFKVDVMSVIWFIVIIFLIISYKADIETCEEIITDPLGYCEESNACKVIEERKNMNPFRTVNIDDIKDLNISINR